MGLMYYRLSAQNEALASMGLIAFAGVAQFLPSILSGLYWRQATAFGVRLGMSAGVVFTQAFGFNNDWLGLGFIWNDPSDGNRADDYGVEAFWRVQLTETLQITPDTPWAPRR